MKDCIFCNIQHKEIIIESKLSHAIYDKFPVNKGHVLIIPKKHISSYFDLEVEEKNDLWDLVEKTKEILDDKFNPDGYNVGINIGKEAGQTIFHCHIHLIPRYLNDIKHPEGGVRAVIPSKQKY